MRDDFGARLDDEEVVARVKSVGCVTVHRSPIERDDVPTWRRGLRQMARSLGIRLSVRKLDGLTYVVLDADYVPSKDQLRATVEALAVPPEIDQQAKATTPAVNRRRLQSVEAPGVDEDWSGR